MFNPHPDDHSNSLSAVHHTTAASIHHAAQSFFQSQEVNTHFLYSDIITRLAQVQSHSTRNPPSVSGLPFPQPAPQSSWITIWTEATSASNQTLDLVVGITSSNLGPRPLFIASPHPSAMLEASFLRPRLSLLTFELLGCIPVERVFSVLGASRFDKWAVQYQAFLTRLNQVPSV